MEYLELSNGKMSGLFHHLPPCPLVRPPVFVNPPPLVSLVFALVLHQAHLVFGNLVEPGLFGESFELSPVVVLLSLAFWGSLWVSKLLALAHVHRRIKAVGAHVI